MFVCCRSPGLQFWAWFGARLVPSRSTAKGKGRLESFMSRFSGLKDVLLEIKVQPGQPPATLLSN
jgi:hypothetical protein